MRVGDTTVSMEGTFGAQLAVGDIDQDGMPDVATTVDGADDAVNVFSLSSSGEIRGRLHLAAPAGVRALAMCPAEARGEPALVAVVGSELWLVRAGVPLVATAAGTHTEQLTAGPPVNVPPPHDRSPRLLEEHLGAGSRRGRRLRELARARGRIPYGGQLVMHVPWPLDQHRPALASTTPEQPSLATHSSAPFTRPTRRRSLVASLAEGSPQPDGATLRVTLRPELRFASGAALDAHAAAFSIARARARDARGWLADVPAPLVDGGALVFAFARRARTRAESGLALVAVVAAALRARSPRQQRAVAREMLAGGGLLLTRNPLAPSGSGLPRRCRGPAGLPRFGDRRCARFGEAGQSDLGVARLLPSTNLAQGARSFDVGDGRVGDSADRQGRRRARCARDCAGARGRGAAREPRSARRRAILDARPGCLDGRSRRAPRARRCALACGAGARSRRAPFRHRRTRVSVLPGHRPARWPSDPAREDYALMLDVARPRGSGAARSPPWPCHGRRPVRRPWRSLATPPRGDPVPRSRHPGRCGSESSPRCGWGRAGGRRVPCPRVAPWGRGVDWGPELSGARVTNL